MQQHLIDTDIIISLLKGKHRIVEKIAQVGIDHCFISEITIAELTYGAVKSNDYERHIKEMEKIEMLFGVLPIYSSLSVFAAEKVRLQKAGTLIPDFDLLIGTTAIANNMILVSNNGKHLQDLKASC